MEHSYKYFKNVDCKYYPCHDTGKEDFNCLFCFCPMNRYDDCPGTPNYIHKKNNTVIKDCSKCTFPHNPDNYDEIISFLSKKMNE